MKIKVKYLKGTQIIPEKVDDLFFKEWEKNKHNINLTEEDYNLALFYYNVGYSIGFHYGFNAQKSTQASPVRKRRA